MAWLGIGRLMPDLGAARLREGLRASVGAAIGLLVTGLVSRAALGPTDGLSLLIAPMGASAVLLFAVPSSPLAQPWSIIGGNVVAASIGVTAARYVPDPIVAAALGGGLAIAAMIVLRCLHPPSGAVALTAVLGGPAITAAGYMFVVWPVGLNSVLILVVALVFNNATGRRYPHRMPVGSSAPGRQLAAEAVLRRHAEVIDVAPQDLVELLDEVDAEDLPRQPSLVQPFGAELMHRASEAIPATASLPDALDALDANRTATFPVIDPQGRCLGLVRQAELLRQSQITPAGRGGAWLLWGAFDRADTQTTVSALAKPLAVRLSPASSLGDLVEAMVDHGVDTVPIIDQDRLVGIVTQADLLRALAGRRRAP